ncbi:Enhancer of polycomb-like protein [Lasiodiplodia theobromae]|uniref:Enhancer of polycomb-like protein n=1 Tax=Lasiodiplodia theobromae TaxID=45133 RepID=A0A5N5DFD8_9PEZI|nr:Enhancer of polycomb-like protein [Lasiodiplodia theobromae]KAB2576539.1 Enhancer of polycomb-like protein 1 [Lasiodiplodia theobromae]KAF4546594.1 Enhancer of polycomb-like protein [Lasiodiplodia theobromae]
MTQRISSQRFRQRKLSTKQNLAILRESEVENLADDEAQRHIPKVETGVEKGEEIEHHLQAVINAAAVGGKVSQLYIPTPDATVSKLKYDDVYPKRWVQPATYIRFSSTVEDCKGTQYCMTSEDEVALKALNAKKPPGMQCTEDWFEEVFDFFERTAQEKQPFAAVDNPPALPYEEFENSFDETISDPAQKFAKDIYDYWKQQRLKRGNHSLMPMLKFETNLETDDSDPYVCFRRREVRQARKTRGRDAQVTEKLKKLRHELEQARELMYFVKQREYGRRDQLVNDRLIFEKRMEVKEIKRNLGIKGDDEDLINQRPAPKPKPKLDPNAIQRGVPGMVSKPQLSRVDGRPLDNDLITLEEQLAKREDEITRSIETNKEKHREWNKHYVDVTWRAITPPLEEESQPAFRAAMTEYLPTPPASVSSEEAADANKQHQALTEKRGDENSLVRYATPPQESFAGRPSFRRRTGRGGRLMIDRRGLKRPANEDIDDRVAERFKYDRDSDEEDDVIPVDFYADAAIKYRILMDRSVSREAAMQQAAARRSLAAAAAAAAQGQQHPAQAGQPTPQRITNGPS